MNPQTLGPQQLDWCCRTFRKGENYVFADIYEMNKRVHEETESSRLKAKQNESLSSSKTVYEAGIL